MTSPSSAPEVTDDMRASARANPNCWLYVLDPAFVDAADVPQWAIVGAYPVDAAGRIEDRFAPNDAYRPSPTALGWPAPLTELELLIQLAKAGHRPVADVLAAVLVTTLLVFDPGDGTWQGTPLIALPDGRTGRLVVPACTSAEHVPSDWLAWRAMRGNEIVPLLRGYPLAINPDGPVSAILPAELLGESVQTNLDVHGTDDGDVLHGRHHAG
jgi:hypothetical protein